MYELRRVFERLKAEDKVPRSTTMDPQPTRPDPEGYEARLAAFRKKWGATEKQEDEKPLHPAVTAPSYICFRDDGTTFCITETYRIELLRAAAALMNGPANASLAHDAAEVFLEREFAYYTTAKLQKEQSDEAQQRDDGPAGGTTSFDPD